jgi:hypothetical protein
VKEAVVKAIARTMGIPHVYVVFVGCTEVNLNLRWKELQAAMSINVMTETSVPVDKVEGHNKVEGDETTTAIKVFESLKTKLTETFESGNFTEILQETSKDLKVAALEDVQVATNISVGPMDIRHPPSSAPFSKPSLPNLEGKNETQDDLVVIIVAILAAVIAIGSGAGAWYYYHSKNKEHSKVYSGVDIGSDDATVGGDTGPVVQAEAVKHPFKNAEAVDMDGDHAAINDNYDLPGVILINMYDSFQYACLTGTPSFCSCSQALNKVIASTSLLLHLRELNETIGTFS